MRTFIAILVFLLCILISMLFSLKYLDKKKFYTNFFEFNKKLKGQVSFERKTINKLVLELEDNEFGKILKKYYLSNLFEFDNKIFSKDEKKYLEDYLYNLGKSNSKTQLEYLELVEKDVQEMRNNAVDDEKKYRKLYLKLGFLIGLICFIIII